MKIDSIIIGFIFGTISSFGGILLQSYLGRRQIKNQSLMEIRLSIYAKLLSAGKCEEIYPREPHSLSKEEVDKYNVKVNDWRKNRKILQGIAMEAFLLTESLELRNKLLKFISTSNPDERFIDAEEIMRKEIGI